MTSEFKKTSEQEIVIKPAVTVVKENVMVISTSGSSAVSFFSTPQKNISSKESIASNVAKLLDFIANGEQDKAEALLKENPDLLLESGTVIDPAKRCFKNIKGFQLALWQLDKHMWEMILKYLSMKEAAKQFQELEENGTEYGKFFDLNPLIDALKGSFNKFKDPDVDLDECVESWCKKVGGEQALLVPHVVNEYCRLDRSFKTAPSFEEATLPRTRRVFASWDSKDEWFSLEVDGGKLGETFAYRRGEAKTPIMEDLPEIIEAVEQDINALQKLFAVRTAQRQSLRDSLLNPSKADAKEQGIKQKFDSL